MLVGPTRKCWTIDARFHKALRHIVLGYSNRKLGCCVLAGQNASVANQNSMVFVSEVTISGASVAFCTSLTVSPGAISSNTSPLWVT